jgi:hypothetical protein
MKLVVTSDVVDAQLFDKAGEHTRAERSSEHDLELLVQATDADLAHVEVAAVDVHARRSTVVGASEDHGCLRATLLLKVHLRDLQHLAVRLLRGRITACDAHVRVLEALHDDVELRAVEVER